jgi:hypothetical protein
MGESAAGSISPHAQTLVAAQLGPFGGKGVPDIMSRLLSRAAVIIVTLVVLGPMILGTEPIPPPYHQLVVRGQVQRSSGGPRQNFAVTLVGRFSFSQADTIVELVAGFVVTPGDAINSVTDTGGAFFLDLKCHAKPDSLAVKVSAVDRADVLGEFFSVPEASTTIMGEYRDETSGCNGCGTTEPAQSYIKGYQYQLPSQTVLVPY